MPSGETVSFTDADIAALSDKLEQFYAQLSPAEQGVVTLLLRRAEAGQAADADVVGYHAYRDSPAAVNYAGTFMIPCILPGDLGSSLILALGLGT
jgi:hypothetical protein